MFCISTRKEYLIPTQATSAPLDWLSCDKMPFAGKHGEGVGIAMSKHHHFCQLPRSSVSFKLIVFSYESLKYLPKTPSDSRNIYVKTP